MKKKKMELVIEMGDTLQKNYTMCHFPNEISKMDFFFFIES